MKKYFFIILILLCVFFPLGLPLAQAATLTYNNDSGVGDNDWANTLDWETGIIAGPSDTALVTANVATISSGVASVFLADFSNGAIWGSNLPLTVEDMATFNDTSSNDGTINGNATFNGTSYNSGGTIKGNATFDTTWYSDTTSPSGGVLTINGSNYWSGDVTGTVYGSDYQPITSYVFNNSSYIAGGTINGNATLNTIYYSGTTAPSGGVLTINGSNYWSGDVTGTVYGSDNEAITSYVFNDSSFNQGIINGNATLNTTYYSGATTPSGGVLTINGNLWSGDVTGTVYGSDNEAITSYIFNDGAQDYGTIKGDATFNDSSFTASGSTIKGNATFNDTSYNDNGTIDGNATFNGTSYNEGGIINGNATLDTTWYSGTTTPSGGVLTINGSNYWSGDVTGKVYGSDNEAITSYIFNDSTYNQGIINGNATFNGASYNDGGTINGNETLDTTYYSGTTAPSGGVLTINGSNYWLSDVTGTVYGSDNEAITSYVFNDTAYNKGTIKGDATFNDTSYNLFGTVNGNATFNDTSYNEGGTINGNATFNGTSYNNDGTVNGNATLDTTWYSGTTAPSGGVLTINGSNSWSGDVTGTVYGSDNEAITSYVFNDSAYNTATINGNATFNGASYNDGGAINGNETLDTTYYSGTTAPSGGVLTINGSNFWLSNVTGTVYGSDNEAITSYVFNDSAYSLGTINGNATFNDTSTNSSGTINGNATFNDTSYNNFGAIINGNAVFNGTSYNDFGATINGSVVFNSTADQSGTINAGSGTVSGNFSTTYGIILESGTVLSDISGTGDLTKTGSSTVILSGSNSYSGITLISDGTLQIGNNGATGSVGTGDVIDDTNLAFDLTNGSTVSNIISGPGTVTQNGTGTVTLSGTNTYSGATTVNAGTLEAGVATQAFGLASAVAVAVGGTLDLGGYNETIASLTGAGTITNSGGTDAVLTTGGSNTSTTFSGNIQDGTTNKAGLTKTGTGTFVLSGDNTYSGPTTLNAGILNLGSSTALGHNTTIDFGGGILQYSSSNNTDYSGQFSAAPGQEYNIDTNGQNVTFASQLNSTGGILTKIGNGTLTLTNSNNYSGGTTINAGILQVENTNALGSGSVTNNSTLV